MTRRRATTRRGSSATRGRRSAARAAGRREGLIGRLGRTVFAGVLLVVVLLIAASYLGLLGRRDLATTGAEREEGVRVYQALAAHPEDRILPSAASSDPLWRPLRQDTEGTERDRPPVAVAAGRGGDAQETEAGSNPPPDRAGEPAGQPPDSRPSVIGAPVRVHLANGCGVDRLAAGMRDRFRRAGFDVCGVDNADRNDYAETLVIDRGGDRAKAAAVCDFLHEHWGVGRVVRQVRSAPMTDVLVVLGPDLAAALQSSPAP